jgi:hypothetical protein
MCLTHTPRMHTRQLPCQRCNSPRWRCNNRSRQLQYRCISLADVSLSKIDNLSGLTPNESETNDRLTNKPQTKLKRRHILITLVSWAAMSTPRFAFELSVILSVAVCEHDSRQDALEALVICRRSTTRVAVETALSICTSEIPTVSSVQSTRQCFQLFE